MPPFLRSCSFSMHQLQTIESTAVRNVHVQHLPKSLHYGGFPTAGVLDPVPSERPAPAPRLLWLPAAQRVCHNGASSSPLLADWLAVSEPAEGETGVQHHFRAPKYLRMDADLLVLVVLLLNSQVFSFDCDLRVPVVVQINSQVPSFKCSLSHSRQASNDDSADLGSHTKTNKNDDLLHSRNWDPKTCGTHFHTRLPPSINSSQWTGTTPTYSPTLVSDPSSTSLISE